MSPDLIGGAEMIRAAEFLFWSREPPKRISFTNSTGFFKFLFPVGYGNPFIVSRVELTAGLFRPY
jgi:hypothetical protein